MPDYIDTLHNKRLHLPPTIAMGTTELSITSYTGEIRLMNMTYELNVIFYDSNGNKL